MTVLRYTVPPENEGCKLGLFLRMQGVTAGLIKSVKYDGDGFYADDQPIRTNEPVHAGQCIRFALPPEQETSVTPQPVPFSIAYEDDFAAVLNKPAGIAVHPTLNYPDGTLANGWLYHLQQRGESGIFRPVNRIDKNTSGLVLCAKTPLPHRCRPGLPTSATLRLCRVQCRWGRAGSKRLSRGAVTPSLAAACARTASTA